MKYEYLIFEADSNGIASITLDRPESLNALSRGLMRELAQAFDEVNGREDVRAVILSGSGRSFCAGFDLKEEGGEESHPAEEWMERFRGDFECFQRIWRSGKPFVAAVHGHCLGGGLEMMLQCDFAIGAEGAVFGKPEARMGGGIGPGMVLWMTHMRAARQMLLLGEFADAEEAYRLGILNRVVPPEKLAETAREIAAKLAEMPPTAMRLNKRTINEHYELIGMRNAISHNLAMGTLINATEEARTWESRLQGKPLKEFLKGRDKK